MKKQGMLRLAGALLCGILSAGIITDTEAVQTQAAVVDVAETEKEMSEGLADVSMAASEGVFGMDEEGNYHAIADQAQYAYIASPDNSENEPKIGDYFVNFKTKSIEDNTYFTDTSVNRTGYVNGNYGADGIYLGKLNGQIMFMIAGGIGVVDAEEVELIHKDDVKSFSYYEVVNGNLIHRITTDMYTSGYSSSLNNGPAPEYLETGIEYYSYDGHYFYEDLSVMVEDYKIGFRDNALNAEEPFFNYFQFLPMRSYSEYTAEEMKEIVNSRVKDSSKLKDTGDTFVEMQNVYGVNALLAAGVAANESSWGNSNMAQKKNNLFGINAKDSSTEDAYYYKSTDASVKDFMEDLLSKKFFNPDDYYERYRGTFLGNKASGVNVKYSSDPYWGEKVAAIAWILNGYGVDMFDKTDAYVYTIGVKDANSYDRTNMNIRREPDQSSLRLYRTNTQPGHTFIILDREPVNGYYKIQSDPVLNYSRTAIADSGEYSKYSMYAYAASDYITIVSEGTKEDVNKVEFKDVPEESWFYPSVEYVVENGIMAGFTYDTFGPYSNLARSQFPVLLYRLEGEPEVEYTKKFKDVPDGTWYTDAILWANENGIVSGYTNGYYGVNDSITREQMAVMMHRYAEYKGYYVGDVATIKNFDDIKKVSDYAEDALRWAVGSELLYGKENGTLLDPQGVANRSEGAAIFMRFMNYYR